MRCDTDEALDWPGWADIPQLKPSSPGIASFGRPETTASQTSSACRTPTGRTPLPDILIKRQERQRASAVAIEAFREFL